MSYENIPRPDKMPDTFHGFLPPYPLRQMTDEETELFLRLAMMDCNPDEFPRMHDMFNKDFMYGIVDKRLRGHSVCATPPVTACIALFCASPTAATPAQVVIGAWTLTQWYRKDNLCRVCVADLSGGPFADGWPDFTDTKAWNDCWAAQKHQGINLVDVLPW